MFAPLNGKINFEKSDYVPSLSKTTIVLLKHIIDNCSISASACYEVVCLIQGA